MPTIDQLIQAIKLAPRYLVAVAIFCGILLFGSKEFIETIGVYQFTQDYRQWLGVTFIASVSLVLMDWGIKVHAIIRNRMHSAKREKSILQSLNCLTEEEKQILRYYIAKQSKTNTLRTNDGVVNGLVAKGIIYIAARHGTLIEGFAHNISDLAWDYLNLNPELLDGDTSTYRTDKRNYFR